MPYVAFNSNRTAKANIEEKTPYEVFCNKTSFQLKLLHKFGRRCDVQIPEAKRKKFEPKGKEGMFIEYPTDMKG